MAVYCTRAVARPAGYYRSLNNRSMANAYALPTSFCNTSIDGLYDDIYEVERLISSRNRKGGAEYLVLWAGYRKEEATWVKEENITLAALGYFHNPQPSYRDIADSVSNFTTGVNHSLKLGVNQGSHLIINFRTDVIKHLFKTKGSNYEHGSGNLYSLDYFDAAYFSEEWYKVYDKLGNGCEVEFPVRMCSRLKWSSTVYAKPSTNLLTPKCKHYEETCSLASEEALLV